MAKILQRGKYVSRSTYQKVCEENKKLLVDIKILTDEKNFMSVERIFTVKKWRDKFAKDSAFNEALTLACKQYLKEHPEFDIKLKYFVKPIIKPK